MAKAKKLWTCPKCGRKFVTKNLWHSCGKFDFDHHFDGKEVIVRKMFLKFRKMVKSCGPVTCYPQKTRIVFMDRMRFGGCQTRKNSLQCALILANEYRDHDCLIKVVKYYDKCFGHYYSIRKLSDFNRTFMKHIREAYLVGQQKFRKRIN